MNPQALQRLQIRAARSADEISQSIKPSVDVSDLIIVAEIYGESSGLKSQVERIIFEYALIRRLADLAAALQEPGHFAAERRMRNV